MTALISLLLLFGAIWFLSTLKSGSGMGREPMDSVSDFSRAMRALDPTAQPQAQHQVGVQAQLHAQPRPQVRR